MKRVAIVYRIHTDKAVASAKSLSIWLKKRSIEVFTAPDQKKIPGTVLMKSTREFKKIDLVLVMGGDGTYLRAVRVLQGQAIPIIGFNMGTLGFLTSFSSEPMSQVQKITADALEGKIAFFHRSMIGIDVFKGKKKLKSFSALNDLVIERGGNSQLINCVISSDDLAISSIKADGFIVATPTGSTAYNLAAGGPLLHPESTVFVVTPVAPHSLTSRPLIIPDHKKLSFRIVSDIVKAHLIVDGQKEMEINSQHEVVMTRSQHTHLMAKSSVDHFFHLLREKLKY
ncbi:MAG: NAD(+)/NADH kinase [Pseudobdellovibrionaceae bacterium]